MKFVGCPNCKSIIQLGGEMEEIRYLLSDNKNFPCITPLCRGRMSVMPIGQITDEYKITELPVRNFFRAANGFGTGIGAPASFERARELLLSRKVVEVVGHPIGQPERTILKELVLDNGARLHFEDSTHGACIYYIEEQGPTCREVVENELAASASAESVTENREEAGRVTEATSEVRPLDIWAGAPSEQSRAAQLQDSERLSAVSKASGLPTSGVFRPPWSGHR